MPDAFQHTYQQTTMAAMLAVVFYLCFGVLFANFCNTKVV